MERKVLERLDWSVTVQTPHLVCHHLLNLLDCGLTDASVASLMTSVQTFLDVALLGTF
jgi:hypothetical protein